MKAYINSIAILDDDEEIIGHIVEDSEGTYIFKAKPDVLITGDEYRFIADVLDKENVYKEIDTKGWKLLIKTTNIA